MRTPIIYDEQGVLTENYDEAYYVLIDNKSEFEYAREKLNIYTPRTGAWWYSEESECWRYGGESMAELFAKRIVNLKRYMTDLENVRSAIESTENNITTFKVSLEAEMIQYANDLWDVRATSSEKALERAKENYREMLEERYWEADEIKITAEIMDKN